MSFTISKEKIAIPFVENVQAIDHVLFNVIQLRSSQKNQIKLWFASYNIKSISMLSDLFRACPENVNIPSYKNGPTILELPKLLNVTLDTICKVAEHIGNSKGRAMTNKDWLNLTRKEYQEAKLQTIIRNPTQVSSKQSSPSNTLPDWYPRTKLVTDHNAFHDNSKALNPMDNPVHSEKTVNQVVTADGHQHFIDGKSKGVVATDVEHTHKKGEHKHEDSIVEVQALSPVPPKYDPAKPWIFEPLLHIMDH